MPIIPLLKTTAIQPAIAFYTQILDFQLVGVWPGTDDPAYGVLTREGDELHLSSHAGDGVPGQKIIVLTAGAAQLLEKFRRRGLPASPKLDSPIHQGVVRQTWGTQEFAVDTPDGHTLTFAQR